MKRRKGLKAKRMRRLRVLVSVEAYEKLRSFAPEHGAGAILEHLIERECRQRQRRPVQREAESPAAKVSPYEKSA